VVGASAPTVPTRGRRDSTCHPGRSNDEYVRDRSFAWQDGYGAFTVSPSHKEATVAYIQGQEEHHHVRTFQEEYREFLRRQDITWDERYVWGYGGDGAMTMVVTAALTHHRSGRRRRWRLSSNFSSFSRRFRAGLAGRHRRWRLGILPCALPSFTTTTTKLTLHSINHDGETSTRHQPEQSPPLSTGDC